ncbi:hypothetical protein DNH61_14990 [Paenibacillus sambharensis]|uniref:Uncharacterized protein n=1 Tax=Paenibacillus sambharensis TaxID=1803190 RepID=A0A2W1LTZ8_9BACL|nr:pilus assembly protein [Paenibacillus sambharensis]PZD94947.1 hypothetical protein DNH61_14990 [Paenibacillus sambharensis]
MDDIRHIRRRNSGGGRNGGRSKRGKEIPRLVKREGRSAFRSVNGSVSLYLVMIASVVLLFMSVLIDYARIAAFERQVESAAYAGVRSVLSAYDETLYSRYGLFGRGGTDSLTILQDSIEDGMLIQREQSFQLLRGKVENLQAFDGDSLGLHPVLRRQILEDMKYKAPADFAMELANRLKPLSSSMKEAKETVQRMDELRKLYDKRQKHLLQALAYQRQAAQEAEQSGIGGLVPSAFSVVSGYASYQSWIASDAAREEGTEPEYEDEIAQYAASARSTASQVGNAGTRFKPEHDRLLGLAAGEVASAKAVNERMKQAAAALSTAAQTSIQSGQSAGSNGGSSGGMGGLTGSGTGVSGNQQDTERLVLPDRWFDEYQTELDEQKTDAGAIQQAASRFQSSVYAAVGGYAASDSGMPVAAASLSSAYTLYSERYLSPGSRLAARERAIRYDQAADDERKALERQAESKMSEARQLLDRVADMQHSEEAAAAFEELKGLYEHNRSLNEQVSAAGEAVELSPSGSARAPAGELDSGGTAAESMSSADQVFGGLSDTMLSIRDELYINEYAVHRFTSLSPDQLGLMPSPAGGGTVSPVPVFAAERQEVEYILYGSHDQKMNLGLAYGEIFTIRLAVRTMEGLIECRSLGHPLLILAAAVVYGIEKTLEDMAELFRDGTTPISKYIPGELRYKDYLRLFLLIHGSEADKLSRMSAVIEHNTGYRLHEIPAAVSGEVKASVRLWFLPGVMRMVGYVSPLQGKVVGNRYETTKTAAWSY